jgi:uncharacterized membrane protein
MNRLSNLLEENIMKNRNRHHRDNGDKENCPVCGVSVKSKNLSGHLKRVHPDVDKDDLDDYERPVHSSSKKAEKRMEMRMQQRKKQDLMFVLFIVIFAVAAIGGYFFYTSYMTTDDSGTEVEDIGPEPIEDDIKPTNDNEVRIPISSVDDGQAHFYSYNSNGVNIRYFVLKSSDGVIRSAFDTCDVCYDAKKGYRQEGDDMVCNNCGQRFASIRINEEKGGCNPAPLDRTVDGSDLVINVNDLNSGRWYFQ